MPTSKVGVYLLMKIKYGYDIAGSVGGYSESIRRVFLVDTVAIIALVLAGMLYAF